MGRDGTILGQLKDIRSVPIKPVQSILGTDPDKTTFILPDGDDLVVGQSVTGPQGCKPVLTLKLHTGKKEKYTPPG